MKLLLDTHAFLWWSDEKLQNELSPPAFNAIMDAENSLYLSVASV
jgi:PIN domain nuclease of toxin-antitoxin system